MNIEGRFVVPQTRAQVWEMLNDPAVLERAIPGCKELERTEDGFAAKISVAIGPVKATFSGNVVIEQAEENVGYTLVGQGTGGVAGFAKGHARVDLEDDEDGTAVVYATEVSIGGKLAQLGSRLIVSTSKKLTNQFFDEICTIANERSQVA